MKRSSMVEALGSRSTGSWPGANRLSPTEWHLLEVLARHQGKLVEQRQLLREVWGRQYKTELSYLRVHFASLRRKLELDPARLAAHHHGAGHRLPVAGVSFRVGTGDLDGQSAGRLVRKMG